MPCRAPPAGGGHRPVPALPGLAPLFHQPLADAGDPHFLPGRGGGGGHEQVLGQPVGLGAALFSGALDARPPRRGQHRGQGEQGKHDQGGMDRHQQPDGDAEAQDPPTGGEQRHVHVIEHEDLVAQDREPVEVVGPLLVGDGRHRRLQPRDVGLEGDGDLVTEATLHASADRAQEPRGGGGQAEADGGGDEQAAVALERARAEQLQPQRQERVGQRGEQRQHERGHQHPRLVAVTEPQYPPHRGESGGQRLTRGRHRPFPPRPRWRRSAWPAARTSCGNGHTAP